MPTIADVDRGSLIPDECVESVAWERQFSNKSSEDGIYGLQHGKSHVRPFRRRHDLVYGPVHVGRYLVSVLHASGDILRALIQRCWFNHRIDMV